jgi:hypothetical protein
MKVTFAMVAVSVLSTAILVMPDRTLAQQGKGKAKCVRCVDLVNKCGDRVGDVFGGRAQDSVG